MNETIIAELHASRARRAFALVVLGVLAFCLLYLAFALPSAGIGGQVFLLLVAAGALWIFSGLYRAGGVGLVLTQSALRDTNGLTLVQIDDVTTVERGTFAFKPSNGFILITTQTGPRRWVPGIWWRLGRRIGIGGITSAPQAKAMAEAIALILADRSIG